jgi:serine/threonine-protein kinase
VVADIPAAVDGVIERALNRDPDARWPSATALKDALQVATGAAAADPRPSPVAPPARQPFSSAPGMTAPLAATSVGGAPEAARQGTREVPLAQPGATGPAAARAPESPKSPDTLPAAAGDDGVERWLVQKELLDFGPFSMAQLRVQIERGEVLGEHILMNNETGARCRIKEYPGLGDLAKRAHRNIEQARRAQAEQRSAKSEKKKSFATTLIVGLVLASVLGGVGFYVISRRDSAGGRLASREEEKEIESFLKGVKISGLKASVRRAGHRSPGNPSGGSAEDFNNDSTFGDASKGFAEGDQTLDDDQIQNTMMANYRKLIPCIVHSGANEIAMEFVVRGNGKVGAVKVNGQRTGALPACLLGRMQGFNFPKFNGSKTIASWSMSMGR